MKTEALILNRISDEKQAGGYSLAAQEKYAKQYCEKNNFNILKIYSFVETGSKPGKRSKFDALMKDIKAYVGKSNMVLNLIVEKPDRLTRNFTNREQLQFFVMLGKLKIHYYKDHRIIDENCSPAEIFTDNIMTALNKYTADNIRRESLKGMTEKASQGHFPGHAPLGYKNIREGKENRHGRKEAKIIIDPETKDAVIRIFELRAKENMSYYNIAKAIREEGLLPLHRLKNFKKQNVEKTLKNIFYGGSFNWRGETFKGQHEVFVLEDYYNAVHDVLPKKIKKRPYGAYSLLIKCGLDDCGCTVIYDPKIKTIKATGEVREYKYYHCCDAKNSLQNLEDKEDRIYDDHIKGLLDESGYKRQIERVRSERDHYTDLLQESDELISDQFYETADKLLELTKYSKSLWKMMLPEERVELLKKVTSNRVFDGASVRYNLKKPFKILAEIKKNGQKENWCRRRTSS